ncbi:MAG: hypothetical protein IJX89_01140 [Alphaproteobacteria bacterium]|nr:hypothetical protein [Alphaproteobacteria bacterium]
MSQKTNNKHKRPETVADKAMTAYKEFISETLYSEYGIPKDIKGSCPKAQWRRGWAHDPRKENFIITQTKVWLHTLDWRDSNSTNPQFLLALVNRIANYLSLYFEKAPKRTHNQTVKLLKQALWNNNMYIQALLVYQSQKRATKKNDTPRKRALRQQQEHKQQASNNYKLAQQIRIEFIEVSTYRKK